MCMGIYVKEIRPLSRGENREQYAGGVSFPLFSYQLMSNFVTSRNSDTSQRLLDGLSIIRH